MKNFESKKIGYFLFFFCFSFILLLFTSSSTSPFYNVFFGDYAGNQTSIGLIIGKGWSQGLIPYRDLFGTSGPLFYLIQAIGWTLGKRTGVFLLQLIHFSLFLLFVFQIMKMFVKTRTSILITCYLALPYISMSSSGNSDSEWCLLIIVLSLFLSLKACLQDSMHNWVSFVLGICSGALFLICFRASGIAFGILLFVWLYTFSKEQHHALTSIVLNLLGVIVIILPFFLYFFLNGCFTDFLLGHVSYNIKELLIGSESLNLILRKVIKCAPAWILLFTGYISLRKSNKYVGILFISISLPSIILLILGQGLWYYYLLFSVFLPTAIGPMLVIVNRRLQKILVLLVLSCILVMWLIPAKAFVIHLLTSDTTNLEIAKADIQTNMEEKQLDQLFIIEKPSALYLALDIMPHYKYFAYQIGMQKVDETISSNTYNYITKEYKNGVLLYGSGWINEWIGPYQLVTYYTYNHSTMGVYLYNIDNMPEDEHEDEQ